MLRHSSWLVVGLAIIATRPDVAHAADELAAKLLDKVPILTPDNKSLTSFQFSAELAAPMGFLVPVDVGWTRPDDFGALFMDQNSQTPIAFVAQKKVMFYDATESTITVAENARPSIVLRATADKITIMYGVTNKEQSEFVIDLPSFIRNARPKPKITKLGPTNWRLTYSSKSGLSKLMATFDTSQSCALRNFEIRSAKDNALMLAVRNIRVNEKVDARLRKFPSTTDLPPKLKVKKLFANKENAVEKALELTSVVKLFLVRIALHDKELRNAPFLKDVDWHEVERADRMVAPALRRLLRLPESRERRGQMK